jgi:antirestriction protein ArdC
MKVQEIINEKIKEQLEKALEEIEINMVEKGLTIDEHGKSALSQVIRRSIDIQIQNGISGYCYKGINKWLQAFDNENFYATWKQIGDSGGYVKKGLEKDYRMLFVYIPAKYEEVEENGKKLMKCVRAPFQRYHQVYRFQDCENMPVPKQAELKHNNRAETIEKFLEQMKSKGIKWIEAGNRTEYKDETIYIPAISQFKSTELYYATLIREIVKATGSEKYLKRWTDKRHSEVREELLAEVASATICLRYGINPIPETVNDIKKWIDNLNNDEQLFTSAISKAERVLNWMDGNEVK